MAATTIGRATIVDDTGSGLDGTLINSAWVGTAIYDKVDALFAASQTIEKSASGAKVQHVLSNTSNTASSGAEAAIVVGGSSAGDPTVVFTVTGSSTWGIGLDNSVGDYFAISVGGTLGTNNAIQFTDQKSCVLNDAAVATNATDGFLYVASCAGTPTGTPSGFTGRVALVYDTTNNKFYVHNGAWKSVTLA